MIKKLKKLKSGYLVDGNRCVSGKIPEYIQDAIDGKGKYKDKPITVEPEFIDAELMQNNTLAIAVKADKIILEKYSALKQRKLLSIGQALQDKQIQGQVLTVEEETLLQTNRDVNTWITNVRVAESIAIAAGTLLADIVWPVQ